MKPQLAKILGIDLTSNAEANNPSRTQTYRDLRLGVPVSTKIPAVAKFHDAAIAVIQEETSAVVKACNAVPQDLKSEVRAARQIGLLQLAAAAMDRRLATLAGPVRAIVKAAQDAIDQAMHVIPTDPAAQAAFYIRAMDARQQIAAQPPAVRVAAAVKMAKAGSDLFLEVFENSLTELIQPGLLKELTAEYQQAAIGEENTHLIAQAQEGLAEVDSVARSSKYALSAAANGLGFSTDWYKAPFAQSVRAWPARTKAQFIAQRGEDTYAQLLTPQGDASAALPYFRPGL